MFIALEGIDGAGKTTLARWIAESRPEKLKFVSRHTIIADSKFVEPIQKALSAVLWEYPESRDLSSLFWLYLQGAWHVMLGETTLKAVPNLVMDGWYYKFLSRLIHQGVDQDKIEAVFALAPKPDAVILLNVDPMDAWSRKPYRLTEMGLHSSVQVDNAADAFAKYQEGTFRVLSTFAQKFGWTIVNVPAGESAEQTLARVMPEIDKFI